MIDPQGTLDAEARKLVQKLDRRRVGGPPTATQIAVQKDDEVITNSYRILNVQSQSAHVMDDPANSRSNLIIPGGYLMSVVDSGSGSVALTADVLRPQVAIHVHDNLQITQWTVIGDRSGSITFDLRTAPYAGYPTSISSIIDGALPNNVSPNLALQQVATGFPDPPFDAVGAPLGWSYLFADDILEIWVTAVSTVTKVFLTLHCRAWG